AVGASVAHFLNSAERFTQCELATSVLGRRRHLHCCAPAGGDLRDTPDGCNKQGAVSDILRRAGISNATTRGRLRFKKVQEIIGAGFPIIVRIGWGRTPAERAASGHFVVIYGWHLSESGKQMVEVKDPINPDNFF